MKIVAIIVTRSQFIKSAMVSREIRNHYEIQEVIKRTSQYFDYELNGVFLQILESYTANRVIQN